MTGELEYSLPPAIRRISGSFRRFGWFSFWSQIAFGVVAGVTLLSALLRPSSPSEASNPGADGGFFLTIVGLVTVFVGAVWAYRYVRLGRQLRTKNESQRPKPKTAMRSLKLGLSISLGGMLVTLFGILATVGTLFLKAISQPQGLALGVPNNAGQYVQALDILVIQATAVILLAHFCGLIFTLWILNTLDNA